MRFNHVLFTALVALLFIYASDGIDVNQNKTKRNINGDVKPVVFYLESPHAGDVPELQAQTSGIRHLYSSPAPKQLALVSVQQPIQVFEQDPTPKQIAEQQVLYEFQQTPTNAVSNVHVKQLFQPNIELTTPSSTVFQNTVGLGSGTSIHTPAAVITAPTNNQQFFRPNHGLGLNIRQFHNPAATIVNPIQHHHGGGIFGNSQNQFRNQFFEQQPQNNPVYPRQNSGKYIYLNGKIVYNPVHIIPQEKITPDSVYHKRVYHNQQKLPLINYAQRHNPAPQKPQLQQGEFFQGHPIYGNQQNINGQGFLPPITNGLGFHPPVVTQQIDQPLVQNKEKQEEGNEEEDDDEEEEGVEETDDDKPENKGDAEEEDEEEEEDNNDQSNEAKDDTNKANVQGEEEEEEHNFGYELFPFESDDYSDENHFFRPVKFTSDDERQKEENEDDDDAETRQRLAYRQHPKFFKKPIKPNQMVRGGTKFAFYEGFKSKTPERPYGKFRKLKFAKTKGRTPKFEKIEGRFSENVPITHKQKVLKERWYVTKDLEGAASKKVASRITMDIQ